MLASPYIHNRTLEYLRGYVLGGGSAINGMIYTRGTDDDYDRWAEISGDKGWSWEGLLPLIRRNERFVQPAGGRDTTGEYDPRYHGFQGDLFVSLPSQESNDLDKRILEVTKTNAREFPYHIDMSSGRPIGITWMQWTVGGGERATSATTFLNPGALARPNLDVVLNTFVTRVLPVGNEDGKAALRGVEIGDRATQTIIGNLTASKEVILSAGVIGSPQLLLNSGVGDREELEALDIPIIHTLPDVGKNMINHPEIRTQWSRVPVDEPSVDPAVALQQWKDNRTGPLSDGGTTRLVLWSRFNSSSPLWKEFSDPSSGSHAAHVEIVLGSMDKNVTATIGLMSPTSKGAVSLKSNNPFDLPLIDPGMLKTKYDVYALREAVKISQRFFSGSPWTEYLLNASFPDPGALSDLQWETYIRDVATPKAHGVGTAAMSPEGAKRGIVDPDLRVKGVSGLRIVDASVIPHVPVGHTQAPTYFVAERASEMIKAFWA